MRKTRQLTIILLTLATSLFAQEVTTAPFKFLGGKDGNIKSMGFYATSCVQEIPT